MLVSIDIRIENSNSTANTGCMLLLLSFLNIFLFFVNLLIKDLAL